MTMLLLLRKAGMAKRHQAIDLSTKVAVIKAVEAGNRSKTDIAKSFGLPKEQRLTSSRTRIDFVNNTHVQSLNLEGNACV